MTKVKMKDVPPEIWQLVRSKWQKALKAGWHQNLWYRCSLCGWMKETYPLGYDCNECPLYGPGWCRCGGEESKLNIIYHSFDHDKWKASIEDFLDFIESYCGDQSE